MSADEPRTVPVRLDGKVVGIALLLPDGTAHIKITDPDTNRKLARPRAQLSIGKDDTE